MDGSHLGAPIPSVALQRQGSERQTVKGSKRYVVAVTCSLPSLKDTEAVILEDGNASFPKSSGIYAVYDAEGTRPLPPSANLCAQEAVVEHD